MPRSPRFSPPIALRLLGIAGLLLAGGFGPVQGSRAAGLPELKKLRVLLVLDTNSDLKDGVEKDRSNIEWLLHNHVPPDRLDVAVLEGKNVTRDKILAHYRNLKTGPDEALVFFYAGHGVIRGPNEHCLQPQMAKVPLVPRAEVRKAMEQKGAGLVVLLSDTCSTRLAAKPDVKPNPWKPRPVELVELHPVLRCLLFQHRGVVDINAAEDGTGSWGDNNRGGVFTQALCGLLHDDLKTLDRNRDRFLTWREFFPVLSKKTETTFQKWAEDMRSRGAKIDQPTQRPRSYALPDDPPAGPRTYAVVSLANLTGDTLSYRYRWAGEKEWKTAEVPKDGKAHHELLLANDKDAPPAFEIDAKIKGDSGKGRLKAAKWTGTGRPRYEDGREYQIRSDKP